jgi:hypothetical protein
MLLNIVSQLWEEYFLHGSSQAGNFMKLKKQCYAGWTSALNCAQVWTAPYLGKELTLLLILWDQLDRKKKIQASSCMSTSGVAPMNALKWAFKDLNTTYKKSLESYHEMKCTEESKSIHLPTLDHQLMGPCPLLQYKFPWNKANKDLSACPCCGHSLTMLIKSQAGVNEENCEQCTKASANGGGGKLNAVSAIHGCYAYFHICHGHVDGFGCNKCEKEGS